MAKVYTEEVDIERVKVDIKSGEVDIESTKVDIRNKLLSFSDTISEKTINHTVEIFSSSFFVYNVPTSVGCEI